MEDVGSIQVSLAEASAGLIGTTVTKKALGLQNHISESLLEMALSPAAKTERGLASHLPHRGQNLNITV